MDGNRNQRMRLCAVLAVLPAFASVALAGYHDRGNLSLSLGGTVSHSFFYDRSYNYESEVTGEYDDSQIVSEPESYTDLDLSIYTSAGFFVMDRLEVGLSSSIMYTWYPDGNQSDMDIHDLQLFTKYFFDNASTITPYVKAEAGVSRIKSGTYKEDSLSGGLGFGLEVYGAGSFVWFAELSSEYTEYGASLTGSQWENQVYLGVSYYIDLFEEAPQELPPPLDLPADRDDPLQKLPAEVREWIKAAEQDWTSLEKRADERVDGEVW